jgi:hypothetical protein
MNPMDQLEQMAVAGEDLTAQVKAMVNEPKTLKELAELRSEEQRLSVIAERLDRIKDLAEDSQREMQETYRDAHAKRFSDVDWKRALVGGTTSHTVKIQDVAHYVLRPPTGNVSHALRAAVEGPEGKGLKPVTQDELVLAEWLVAVHLLGGEDSVEQDVSAKDPCTRVKLIRQLPLQLVSRLAQECVDLDAWLNVQLELELKNF